MYHTKIPDGSRSDIEHPSHTNPTRHISKNEIFVKPKQHQTKKNKGLGITVWSMKHAKWHKISLWPIDTWTEWWSKQPHQIILPSLVRGCLEPIILDVDHLKATISWWRLEFGPSNRDFSWVKNNYSKSNIILNNLVPPQIYKENINDN